jgi:hypothetical protein
MLRDYGKDRMERVFALTGGEYIPYGWSSGIRAFARGGYIDLRTSKGHTLRLWKHGPMSLYCPHGNIQQQDAMFLLTGAWPCVDCMSVVATIRVRRGMDRVLYFGDLSREARVALDTPSSKIGMESRVKKRRLLEEEVHYLLDEQGYHKPLMDRYKDRFRARMDRLVKQDKELTTWMVTVSMATDGVMQCIPSVHTRAFRQSRRYLYLYLPRQKMFEADDRLVRGGRFLGGIETETATTMVAWAVKVASPLNKTAWALAHFERNDRGEWCFRYWKRQNKGDK